METAPDHRPVWFTIHAPPPPKQKLNEYWLSRNFGSNVKGEHWIEGELGRVQGLLQGGRWFLFSSTVKDKWPTKINSLWLRKRVPPRWLFSKFSMHKNHLGSSINMRNPEPHLQMFTIDNSDAFVPQATPWETLSEKAKKTRLDTSKRCWRPY